MRTKSMLRRIFAIILCFSIFLTNFNGLVIITGEANMPTPGTVDHIADNNTMDTYINALNIAADTQNAGRVWADKSVFTDDIELDLETDGYNGANNIIENDSDFLHVFSTIGSSLEKLQVDEENIPLDLVFVLDFSASMTQWLDKDNQRIRQTIEAVNNAINMVVEKSPNSRIGIVVYSSKAEMMLPLSRLVPEVGETNTQWFDLSELGYLGGTVRFNANVQQAVGMSEWSDEQSWHTSVEVADYSTNSKIGIQTNLQAGLALGMSMLADEHVTKWRSQKRNETYTRTPAVIVMTDGECNLLCNSIDRKQENAWWNTDPHSQYNASIDEELDGIEPIIASTLMTAAYNVTCIRSNYYGSTSVTEDNPVYAYGISVDTNGTATAQQKIYSILNPGEYFNNDIRQHTQLSGVTYTNERIADTYDNLKAVVDSETVDSYLLGNIVDQRIGSSSEYTTIPVSLSFAELPKFTKKEVFDNINYIDSFYDVTSYEQNDVFDKIIKEIINVNMFKPVGGANDINPDSVLTYVDPIGKYMEVKDIKNVLLFGELYSVKKNGGQVYYDKNGREITDQEDIDNRNYAYFQQNYNIVPKNDDTVTNPCYSDEDHEVQFPLSKIEIYTKTTWDFRDPDIEDGNIRSDTGGDQSLYINIPALALPIQKATVLIDVDDTIVEYNTNIEEKGQSTPLRVFYTVGVADAVKTDGAIDLAKLSSDYVAANKNKATGEVYLYSNWYNGKKDKYTHYVTGEETGYTFGDAVITFSPDAENSYYKYQEYLPVYAGDGTDGSSRTITDIDPDGLYHIVTGYYTKDLEYVSNIVPRIGAEFGSGIGGASFGEYLCWYDLETGDVQTYTRDSTPPKAGYILAAKAGGVSIGDMSQNISTKDENQTITSNTYYMPTISDSTSGDILIVNIYLGNNGRCSVADTQLLVTKTVSRIGAVNADILEEGFEYTIKLVGTNGTPVSGSYNAIKVTAAGDGNWRALIKSIELLTNNQGLLLNEGGALATYDYNGAKYYIFVGGDSEEQSFTHTLFEKTDENSLDDLLKGKDSAALNVEAYLVPMDSYSTDWYFRATDSTLVHIRDFEVGNIDTKDRPIGYEVGISNYQSATSYEYATPTLDFDTNGTATFTLRDGEGILLLGLDPGTHYTVTEKLTDEQATDKGILFRSLEHITSTDVIYYGTDNPNPDTTGFAFNNTAHEYSVNGITDPRYRCEAHYCNYVPRAEKELVSTDKGYVNVGDTLEYVIYWENYCPDGQGGYKEADVVITDVLDPGVDFVSAEFVKPKTVTEGGKTTVVYEKLEDTDGWAADYDDLTRTVIWTIPKVEGGKYGYVRLTVKVNENAPLVPNKDNEYDYEISNQGRMSIDNTYFVDTNIVDTPVTDVHKTEFEIIQPDGTTVEVSEAKGNLKQDSVTGNYIAPKVEQGTKIKYKISFSNYDGDDATITIKDRLDPDVALVNANYNGIELNPPQSQISGTTDGMSVTITYYSSRTVEWKIENVPNHHSGEVELTVQVTAEAPDPEYTEDTGDTGDTGGGDSGGGEPEEEEDKFYFPERQYTFEKEDDFIKGQLPNEGAYIIAISTNAMSNILCETTVNNVKKYWALSTKSVTIEKAITVDERDAIKTDDRSIIWIVEYPNNVQNSRFFYLRNAETGEYLYAVSGYGTAASMELVTDKSSATGWVINVLNGHICLSTSGNNSYGLYGTEYFSFASSLIFNSTQFYSVVESNPTPEPPPEVIDPPIEPEPDEPTGIEGDYKIKNTASVKVNSDPKQSTETMENPMAGELIVEKQLYGATHPSDLNKEFEFTVTLTPKTDDKFNPEALSVIKISGEDQTAVTIDWAIEEISPGVYSGEGKFKLKGGEAVHIAGFTHAVAYTVQEAKERDYTLHHVTQNGDEVAVADRMVAGTIDTNKTSTEIVVFYNKSEIVVLPATGGMGTMPYYLFGSLLVFGTLLWLIIEKRKNRCATDFPT